MFKVSYVPVDMNGKAERVPRVRGAFIPRLNDVRRVPVRYQRVLPLPIIKRYQCVVLGGSANTLTVGITERENEALLDLLQVLTGATIFPVLVEPGRMRLLIARIERYQCFHKRYSRAYYTLQLPAHVRLMLAFRER
jgi:hypothetical protein